MSKEIPILLNHDTNELVGIIRRPPEWLGEHMKSKSVTFDPAYRIDGKTGKWELLEISICPKKVKP